MSALLKVENLVKHFPVRPHLFSRSKAVVHAVDGLNFELNAGETMALVGESGCGKSTVGRLVLRLLDATSGQVWFDGEDLMALPAGRLRAKRRELQMIFQDPYSSLNPRMTVEQALAEPLRTHRPAMPEAEVMQRVKAMMGRVGLMPQQINRYPHEFSGGQCQRIGIARALILEPKLIICDEPVSALDVSIQAQIINLLKELQKSMGLALIFIAHDLAVVKHISDRILVMYLGHEMEVAHKKALYAAPRHPYTQALLSAIPIPDPALERKKVIQLLQGDLPSPMAPPSGCVFRTRCPLAIARCAQEVPALRRLSDETEAACLLA